MGNVGRHFTKRTRSNFVYPMCSAVWHGNDVLSTFLPFISRLFWFCKELNKKRQNKRKTEYKRNFLIVRGDAKNWFKNNFFRLMVTLQMNQTCKNYEFFKVLIRWMMNFDFVSSPLWMEVCMNEKLFWFECVPSTMNIGFRLEIKEEDFLITK